MGFASAHVEEEPTTVELGGRTWRKMVGVRLLSHSSGVTVRAVQEAYVTTNPHWAIGLTITATREQYGEYRRAFDALLHSISFK
jgi:hypothetical protein